LRSSARHSATRYWKNGREARESASQISFVDAIRGLVRIRSFWILAIAGVLTAIGAWIFINWLPLYFRENFGMTLTSAGFFGSSLVSVTAAVSQVAGGAVSDVLAKKGLHRRLLMQAVLILCSAPMLVIFVVTKNRIAIMLALVLYSAFRNAGDLNIVPLLCDLAGKNRMSMAIGVTNMLNTVAGGAGILATGFLKSSVGLATLFASVAGILLIDALLLFCRLFLVHPEGLGQGSGVVMKRLKPVDVVVAGAGWTGLAMAKELVTRTAMSVLVLERGRAQEASGYSETMDELDYAVRLRTMQNISEETVTHRHSSRDRAAPIRQYGSFLPGAGVGGSGEHWSGMCFRYPPDLFSLATALRQRSKPRICLRISPFEIGPSHMTSLNLIIGEPSR